MALAAGLLCAIGCAEPQAPSAESPPELVLSGVGLKVFRGGQERALGKANRASFRQHEGAIVAEGGELLVLNSGAGDGVRPTARIRARYATGNLREQVADASGSVELEDAEGTRGATSRAHFDGVSRIASGSEPVRVDGAQGGFSIDAEGGFRLELEDGGKMSFLGPVRSEMRESAVKGAAR